MPLASRLWAVVYAALIPSVYVALLPALTHVQWGAASFAAPHTTWSISHMLRSAPANGAFAAVTGCVVAYAWGARVTQELSARSTAAAVALWLCNVAVTAAWVVIVVVPIDSYSNALHHTAVVLGTAGAACSILLTLLLLRWRALCAAFVSVCLVLFVPLLFVPNADSSPRFFAAEVLAVAVYNSFAPLLDLLRPGIHVRFAS